jgi:hypothetical protein
MVVPQPTVAGFIAFIRAVVGITPDILPDDAPVIVMALSVATAIVNPALRIVPVPGSFLPEATKTSIYVLACYNLASDNLINYAQDLPDAPPVQGSDPPTPFFAWTRKQWNINGFVSGVVQSTSDEGTSVSMVVQDAAKNFTLSNLQNLKTPYGRQYLAFSQDFGPSTWGVT